MNSVQAPIIWGMCAIASKIRFTNSETGIKKIRISFIDSDGHSVLPMIETQLPVQVPPGESTSSTQMIVIMPQLRLPHFGEYSIGLAIDGREEASFPLFAKQIPSPPAIQPPPPEQQLPPTQ